LLPGLPLQVWRGMRYPGYFKGTRGELGAKGDEDSQIRSLILRGQ
jgi:hypothetical protein